MEKMYFIDESLDRMGGVERVISTLSNKLCDSYDITLISLFKSNKEYYFKFNEKINKYYIFNRSTLKSKKFKKGSYIYYFFRVFEKIQEKIVLKFGIKKYAKMVDHDAVVVFGGFQTATKFIPYINCKKIIVREAVSYYCYSVKQKEIINKYFIDKVNIIVNSSDENIEIYKNLFNDKIKQIKIYNPLGIKPVINKSLESKSIISTGRFDKQKGYDYLILAFKLVLEKHPDWKLRIVGDGYYKSEMEKLIKNNSLEKSVILEKPTKDIVSELNKSSIFVLASRFEGYANSLVEAMACGLACISYDWLVGVKDIIKDKNNGLIIPLEDRLDYFYDKNVNNNDIINLAEGINKLIEDKELRKKLALNAPKIIETRNNEKIINKWEDIICK